ncbi:LysR substrate-binding domain-containing protein [Parendozoicomonas haliclonae]|uniref:HTH-type transcriptional activator CmpR n=1 Tax=Parendozoicomonas haliclonae TaxID=1960125 RepID=A0A1X7AKW6_9GAMM|nr:LysR substrate-binding domain-containing protein [Parendozoicomonas haliclonae]SMA47582.1 HTH-type transcriptional activator CmpR [Parendozoicomonas haliclonae]
MHITLRQLEIFRAVAQIGRVTGAAESLYISQPAASMALSELEKHLGPLFDRHQGSSLKLNDAGRALLPKASELIDRAKELENQFAHSDGPLSGNIILNASSTVGNNLMPRILSAFQQKQPGVRIEMEIKNSKTIEQRLLEFKIDMAMVEGTCLHPDIEVTTWLEDELLIICSNNHPLANKKDVCLSELADETWILREHGSGTRELFDEMIAPYFDHTQVGMVLNRAEAVKQCVIDDIGIACLSRFAVKSALTSGMISTIHVRDLNLKRHFYLLTHKKKYHSNMLRQLKDYLLAWQPEHLLPAHLLDT